MHQLLPNGRLRRAGWSLDSAFFGDRDFLPAQLKTIIAVQTENKTSQ
jgi:hypothetical protein